MIQTLERVIDGNTFRVTQLPATRAVRLSHKLLSIVAPAMGYAASGTKDGNVLDADVDFGRAIQSLFDRLPTNEFEALLKELLQGALIDDKPLMPQFDIVMQGRVLTVFKLAAFALEANFRDFFDALAPMAEVVKRMIQKAQGGMMTGPSIGPSGASSSDAPQA